jgi:cytoskeletal protein CcmA (bactofilin family)
MEADKTSVVDAQCEFQGKLTGRDARILGRFRGDIELSGRLATGEGSRVEARIKADSAEIAGEFVGEILVRSLTLTEKARVEGNVQAEVLSVREGAWLQGAVNTGVAQLRPAELRPAISAGPRPPLKTAVS